MQDQESQNYHLFPKESLVKRYKLIWRVLLISNLGLGAYMFVRARMKTLNMGKIAKKDVEHVPAPGDDLLESATTPSIPESPSPISAVLKPKEPIPEVQQRELFEWILEEKRKIKPKNPEEKKQIDEDKAILKQFIRAKSVPGF